MQHSPSGAVVLTGGSAVRLGGADKASLEIAGRTLLEHVLGALTEIDEVVVVGPPVPTSRPVTFIQEDPVGGGPAAGLLAGLAGFPRVPQRVVVLAVDMPLVTSATVRRLTDALENSPEDGAVLVDDEGRVQFLCAVYRTAALTRAATDVHGLSMRALVGPLRLEHVAAIGAETQDVDTWDDVRRLREQFED